MFAGNFAPRSWAFCDGQLLAVSQNDALFSLFGTIYGGDGRTTFALPDLRGRIPIHAGQGPGLSDRRLGAKGGEEKIALTVNQLTSHTHTARCANKGGDKRSPEGALFAIDGTGATAHFSDRSPTQSMQNGTSNVGGGLSHSNVQPFLCIHFIVALVGIYPSRT